MEELFDCQKTDFSGCYKIIPKVRRDIRGKFVKTYHKGSFVKLGLETEFKEEYYSLSHKNVLRGLHFQLPPADHEKLVYCVNGAVIDIILDLRSKSGTYGKVQL